MLSRIQRLCAVYSKVLQEPSLYGSRVLLRPASGVGLSVLLARRKRGDWNGLPPKGEDYFHI